MAYLTYEEYLAMEYVELEPSEFERLLKRASDAVDGITNHFYRFNNIEDDVPFRREQFKKAIAVQIEYFHDMGATNSHGLNDPMSVTIGRTSMSTENTRSGSQDKNNLISPDVFFLLANTGLLYAGIGRRG